MPIIILNNGIKYECPFCGLASVGILYIDVIGLDLVGALEAFSNTEATKNIQYKTVDKTTNYTGYIKLIGVEYAYNDSTAVRVALRRLYESETL